MIITCVNCAKKFDVASNLIPKKGRLLQCMKCKHTWFFKEVITIDIDKSDDPKNPTLMEKVPTPKIDNLVVEKNLDETEFKINEDIKKKSLKTDRIVKKKGNKVIKMTIVFIISFLALVILTDTFKGVISIIVPSVDFLLYSLYESIKDILLFVKDLI